MLNTLKSGRKHLDNVVTMARAGLFKPELPTTSIRSLSTLRRWGRTQAAAYAIDAIRWPNEVAITDGGGALTFASMQDRTNALARGLRNVGIGERQRVGLLCRNGRGFVESVIALAKLGADVVLLNTSFASPQLAQVIVEQEIRTVIHDRHVADHIEKTREALRGMGESHDVAFVGDLEALIAANETADLDPPGYEGKAVVLTSGTTGRPKGAQRSRPSSLDPIADFLKVVPLKARDSSLVAAPLFHSLGYSQLEFAGALALQLVLAAKFDPVGVLEMIERHRVRVLTAVPVMLKRILDLGDATLARYDCTSLEVVIVSGSALPHDIAISFMDRFGPCIYNLYGATELGWATIAVPDEIRDLPGCVGRAVPGIEIAVFDESGRRLESGEVGELFVASEMLFEGYTDSSKDRKRLAGMMSVGDLGYIDERGRVYVESRADDMIVSGAENVYPGEIERLLQGHPKIDEVAVYGVADEEFGQALKAFVVQGPEAGLSEEAVRKYVSERLARFKVPRHVIFLDELPRSSTGKVVKRDLLNDDE